MPDESLLREKARVVIQNGKLPVRQADRTWGGPGVGELCVVCDLAVTRDQIEFEIQFEHDGDNPGLDKFHLHVRCFAAWEFERGKPANNTVESKAHALAGFVRRHFPFALCPRCIASRWNVAEKEIRDVSQVLILQPGFGSTRRTCTGCGRMDDIVEKRSG